MNPKILLAVGAGLAAWFLLTRKRISDRSKLIFRRISFAGGLKNPRFLLDFTIDNPTNQTGTISAVTGEVYVDDKLVADFSNFGEQKIRAKAKSPFRVEAKPAISALALLANRNWLKKGLSYKITGSANLDGIVAPFSYSGKF